MLGQERELVKMVCTEFEEEIVASHRRQDGDRELRMKEDANVEDLRKFVIDLVKAPQNSGKAQDLELVSAINALAVRRMKEKSAKSAQKLLNMAISFLGSDDSSDANESLLRMKAITLNNNGCAARRLGDDSLAFHCFKQALKLNQSLRSRLIGRLKQDRESSARLVGPNACAPLLNISILQLQSGEIESSLDHAREALNTIWENAKERIDMLICTYRVLSIAYLRYEINYCRESALSTCSMYYGEDSSTLKKLKDWNDSLHLFRDVCSKIHEEQPEDEELGDEDEDKGVGQLSESQVPSHNIPQTPPRDFLKVSPLPSKSRRRWIFDSNPGTIYDSQLLSKMKKVVCWNARQEQKVSPRPHKTIHSSTSFVSPAPPRTDQPSSRDVRRMLLRAQVGFATPNAKERVREWIVNNIEEVHKDDVRTRHVDLEEERASQYAHDIAGVSVRQYAEGAAMKQHLDASGASDDHEECAVIRTTGGKRCLPDGRNVGKRNEKERAVNRINVKVNGNGADYDG
ncbi:hypothetical protein GUITHDRAFT_113804 [Guillardia theta CCMP2712]|uniref:Uncharacterized protein n=1 Tax=Guillardia theta (strain CCMP2712) TaxID=905079 RepID=L1IW41_GUITC|nr:hypothetical protein GUITHDRAFT_113804 [Guillardia theta CCMP2712]EKX40065.1 hypothetical protein GUITHDRAFT_113804 [Guillardia theta CCMP2712]|eukprot:XP_005827045.1 hypothetical protein GUITHDRAFT_113804 [Guillardia theta CCMP2712]